MAKLAGLLRKIKELEEKLESCNGAYLMLLQEYTQLKIKYSYEETMEAIKEISKKQRIEGKNLL